MGEALFALYDDGWRLDRASGPNEFIGLDRTSSIAEGNKECVALETTLDYRKCVASIDKYSVHFTAYMAGDGTDHCW